LASRIARSASSRGPNGEVEISVRAREDRQKDGTNYDAYAAMDDLRPVERRFLKGPVPPKMDRTQGTKAITLAAE
jgi:hypothetical protein